MNIFNALTDITKHRHINMHLPNNDVNVQNHVLERSVTAGWMMITLTFLNR